MSKRDVPPPYIAPGSVWEYGGFKYTVMTVCEGHVMFRMKGCGPGVMFWKDFLKRFRLLVRESQGKKDVDGK